VARWVSWRGWFGCPSRMRPLALSGLRVVARVSEAHPDSPLPLGERTCSRARRACPRMPLPVEMAEARAGGRKGGTGAEAVAGRSEVGVLAWVIRVSIPDAAFGLIRATCRSPGKRSAPGFPSPHPSPGREGPGAQRAGFFAVRRVDFFVAFRVGDLRAPVLAAAFFVADFFAAFFVARPVVLRAVFFAAVFFAGLLL